MGVAAGEHEADSANDEDDKAASSEDVKNDRSDIADHAGDALDSGNVIFGDADGVMPVALGRNSSEGKEEGGEGESKTGEGFFSCVPEWIDELVFFHKNVVFFGL